MSKKYGSFQLLSITSQINKPGRVLTDGVTMSDKHILARPVIVPALLILVFTLAPALSAEQNPAGEHDGQTNQWQAPSGAINRPNPVHADEVSIERGERVYRQYCVACHGKSGRGDGPFAERLITEPPDLTTLPRDRTDGELAWKIARGNNPMPGWENILKEEEIWDIVNYIRSIGIPSD